PPSPMALMAPNSGMAGPIPSGNWSFGFPGGGMPKINYGGGVSTRGGPFGGGRGPFGCFGFWPLGLSIGFGPGGPFGGPFGGPWGNPFGHHKGCDSCGCYCGCCECGCACDSCGCYCGCGGCWGDGCGCFGGCDGCWGGGCWGGCW